jgi:hypothetical protein
MGVPLAKNVQTILYRAGAIQDFKSDAAPGAPHTFPATHTHLLGAPTQTNKHKRNHQKMTHEQVNGVPKHNEQAEGRHTRGTERDSGQRILGTHHCLPACLPACTAVQTLNAISIGSLMGCTACKQGHDCRPIIRVQCSAVHP